MIYSFKKKPNNFTYLCFLHFFEFIVLAEVLPLVILFSGIQNSSVSPSLRSYGV